MALTGGARTPILLAGSMFLMTFAIPFANAATNSIYQGQVAPNMQGRVFAAMGQPQLALLVLLGSLTAGPLADRVFPSRPSPVRLARRRLGGGGGAPGSGIGLMYVIAGSWIVGLTVAVYASADVRRVEAAAPGQRTAASAVPA